MKKLVTTALTLLTFTALGSECKIDSNQMSDLLTYDAVIGAQSLSEEEVKEKLFTLITTEYMKPSKRTTLMIDRVFLKYQNAKDKGVAFTSLKERLRASLNQSCPNSEVITLIKQEKNISSALSNTFSSDIRVLQDYTTPLLREASREMFLSKKNETDNGQFKKIETVEHKIKKEKDGDTFQQIENDIIVATSNFLSNLPEEILNKLILSKDALIDTGVTLYKKSGMTMGIGLKHFKGLTRDLGDLNNLKRCIEQRILPLEDNTTVGTLIYKINTQCELDTEKYFVNAITSDKYSETLRKQNSIYKEAIKHLGFSDVPDYKLSLKLQYFNKEIIAKTFGEQSPFERTRQLKDQLNKSLQEEVLAFHENGEKMDEKLSIIVRDNYLELESAINEMRKSVEWLDRVEIFLPAKDSEKLLFQRTGTSISKRIDTDTAKYNYNTYASEKYTHYYTTSPDMMNFYSYGFEKCDISFGDYMSVDIKYYNIGCEDQQGTSYYSNKE